MVQWEDNDGNLYQATIHGFDIPYGYVKKWDKVGKYSAISGAHTVLWQGGGPSVSIWRFAETVKNKAEEYGCPPEKSIKLLRVL
jgi:hypothetical protein